MAADAQLAGTTKALQGAPATAKGALPLCAIRRADLAYQQLGRTGKPVAVCPL